jgi:hypothetical protein
MSDLTSLYLAKRKWCGLNEFQELALSKRSKSYVSVEQMKVKPNMNCRLAH